MRPWQGQVSSGCPKMPPPKAVPSAPRSTQESLGTTGTSQGCPLCHPTSRRENLHPASEQSVCEKASVIPQEAHTPWISSSLLRSSPSCPPSLLVHNWDLLVSRAAPAPLLLRFCLSGNTSCALSHGKLKPRSDIRQRRQHGQEGGCWMEKRHANLESLKPCMSHAFSELLDLLSSSSMY